MQGEPPVSNQQGKQWLNAAKLGETDTLATLLPENPALLHYKVHQLTKPVILVADSMQALVYYNRDLFSDSPVLKPAAQD